MNISILKPVERLFAYPQNIEIAKRSGQIGSVRGDFGEDGSGFYTNWVNAVQGVRKYRNQTFQSDCNAVIAALRKGMLKDRSSMKNFCKQRPRSWFQGQKFWEYGFRVDTDVYTYLIRCIPVIGDYNFYIYAFASSDLQQHLANAKKGIPLLSIKKKQIYRIPDGDTIKISFANGSKSKRICRYMNETRVVIADEVYNILDFTKFMERNGNLIIPLRSSLPDKCFSLTPDEEKIIQIERGCFYYDIEYRFCPEAEMRHYVDQLNEELNVSKAQESAMLAGCLYGWEVPAADPENYDKYGKPKL